MLGARCFVPSPSQQSHQYCFRGPVDLSRTHSQWYLPQPPCLSHPISNTCNGQTVCDIDNECCLLHPQCLSHPQSLVSVTSTISGVLTSMSITSTMSGVCHIIGNGVCNVNNQQCPSFTMSVGVNHSQHPSPTSRRNVSVSVTSTMCVASVITGVYRVEWSRETGGDVTRNLTSPDVMLTLECSCSTRSLALWWRICATQPQRYTSAGGNVQSDADYSHKNAH